MNIKMILCAISLSAFATLQCSDKEQLRMELAAKEVLLKKLGEEIQKQEALYEHAKKRLLELRDLIVEKRKRQDVTDSQASSKLLDEMKLFLNAYDMNKENDDFLLNNQFFGDFSEHVLFKFYTIKIAIEADSLEKLISKWDKCFREKCLIQNQLN